ncbi:MAG: helix-turn-helix domain-containing protein [Solirubrobacterales bacterium]|nr:helix-turn-helix domain-containing protein [Solirubrobacterales bacterium]
MSEIQPNSARRAFFTPEGLARYLAVSERTIYDWLRRGEIASYKLGGSRRIDPADVEAFLAERKHERRVAV